MQTAVEWLYEQLTTIWHDEESAIQTLEQAKEMEKQQIIDAANLKKEDRWFDAKLYNNCGEKYYSETYGSNGSDEHIVDTTEMIYQVPDVRKMVEDDNYLTPVDWLMDRIKWIHRETYDYLIKEGQYDVAKRTENAILSKANELQSSQTEISDEVDRIMGLAEKSRNALNDVAHLCSGEVEEHIFDMGFYQGFKTKDQTEISDKDKI